MLKIISTFVAPWDGQIHYAGESIPEELCSAETLSELIGSRLIKAEDEAPKQAKNEPVRVPVKKRKV